MFLFNRLGANQFAEFGVMGWVFCRLLLLVLACLMEAGSRQTLCFLALRALSRLVWIWHAVCQLGAACWLEFCAVLYVYLFFLFSSASAVAVFRFASLFCVRVVWFLFVLCFCRALT